ncbi:MAG: S41 family peptidase [Bacteroidales bacterium]|jgi:tetratricopeptide (TPR) repeat protein
MKTIKTKRAILVIAVIILFSISSYSQEKITTLTLTEKKEIIETIGQRLNRFYVFPEVAQQMEKHIKAIHKTGAFDQITDPKEFADSVTRELRSICNDKHLALFFGYNPDLQPKEDQALKRILDRIDRESQNYGLNKVDILPGNIGYINLQSVMYYEPIKEIVSAALKLLSNTDAILFDLRENRGGDPQYMSYLFSYFFDKPTQLSSLYFRDRDRTFEYRTQDNIPGTIMPVVPLFVLTSSRTFSAAESFAYDLQSLHRATIIGEVTAGGANPANSFVIYKDLRISIPLGRAINPVTGTNWEGVGVKPDFITSADSTLIVATSKAKEAAAKFHELKKNRIVKIYHDCLSEIDKADILFNQGKLKECENLINSTLNQGLINNVLIQSQINQMGYDYIGQKKFGMAVSILKFNAVKFPESANAFDSLAEAYMMAGDNQHAIENYEKTLQLNPQNSNAIENLKILKGLK